MRRNPALAVLLAATIAGCSDGSRERIEASVDESSEEVALAIDAFQAEVREVTNELVVTVDALDARYASGVDESAAQWALAKAEIAEARYRLEADLAALRYATGAEADALRADITGDVEVLTERVERARLSAVESGRDFLAESGARLGSIDREIEELRRASADLTSGARTDADRAIATLEREARALRATVERLAESAASLEDERDALARDVASLTAAVRRELVELRHDIAS